MDWKTTELRGYTYYSKKGYKILISLISSYAYDFVIEKEGKFTTVNVKHAGLKDKKDLNSWSIALGGGYNDFPVSKKVVDIYLVWLDSHNKFIEINGDFFIGSNSRCKRIPKKYLK